MILVFLSCAWIAGIFVGGFFKWPLVLLLAGIPPLVLAFFIREQRRPIVLTGLGILLFVGAGIYSYSSQNVFDDGDVRYYNERGTVYLEGTVAGPPDVRDSSTRLVIDASRLNVEGQPHEVKGRVLVFVSRYPEYEYGDVLGIAGELRTPPQLEDFDYRGYLEHQGIHTIVYYPRIEVLETGRGNPLLGGIYSLRDNLAASLARALSEPQASLAQGIVLGIRGNIP